MAFPSRHIVLRSLNFYRVTAVLLMLGVAAATAVIVGALLVGDSVRGSMRELVLDRLGRIEHLLIAPRFLDESIAERMVSTDYPSRLERPVGAMVFTNGTAESLSSDSDKQVHRAASILVVGTTEAFWGLGSLAPKIDSQWNEVKNRVILNEALAQELRASIGSEVTLRLPKEQAVPADSPLGKRDDLVESLPRLRVVAIVPNRSLGRFSVRPSQSPPLNAFVDLGFLQSQLQRDGQINALFIGRKENVPDQHDLDQAQQTTAQLIRSMQLKLQDFGLKIDRVTSPPSAKSRAGEAFDYFQITSQQLLLSEPVVQAIRSSLPESQMQPMLTYLANGIELAKSADESTGEHANGVQASEVQVSVPYSTVSAIDQGCTLDLRSLAPEVAWRTDGSLPKGKVLINSWLAEQLGAKVGDRLKLDYYLPETIEGKEVERSAEFSVAGIVPITAPSTPYRRNREAKFDMAPTPFNDPAMTPVVPGITDQDSINDWDLPFVLDRRVRREDDDYWADYRLTSKLYLSLEDGQQLFASRFGKVSSVRVSSNAAEDAAKLAAMLEPKLREIAQEQGLAPLPIYAQHWQASSGTTPFDVLFLSLSFFVIIAALLLVSLLFRLGIEQRANQWGLLMSLGWPAKRVTRLVMWEGWIVVTMGGLLGIVLGIAYAQCMIWGLSRWWVGAIRVAFLEFHASPWSLLLGYGISCVVVWATMRWTARVFRRAEPLNLLRSQGSFTAVETHPAKWRRWMPWGLLVVALLLFALGPSLTGEARAGCFLSGGMLLVVLGILSFRSWLKHHARRASLQERRAPSTAVESLHGKDLIANSIRRNPLRSTLAISMIAFASFLVLAISLFQARPTESAMGGFALQAQSSLAIAKDLQEASVRREVLGGNAQKLDGVEIASFRLRPGDDASCSNLYQASQPRIMGVPARFARQESTFPKERRFPWAGRARPINTEEQASPFACLERQGDGSESQPYPVILDMNTAMWSLHRGSAVGQRFSFEYDGREIWFETVGLLQNSLLQGCLLLSEQHFVEAFPSISGYQFFLIDVSKRPRDALNEIESILEQGWGDEGMDVVRSEQILAQLLAVQNTYLSAFQALGALGLLLGTLGLAVVQTRSVYERRQELAVFRALGFHQRRIRQLLFRESVWLLGIGMGIGGGAAILAVLPAWLLGQPLGTLVSPLVMTLVVLVVGLLSGGIAAWRAQHLPILDSLRGR